MDLIFCCYISDNFACVGFDIAMNDGFDVRWVQRFLLKVGKLQCFITKLKKIYNKSEKFYVHFHNIFSYVFQ